MMNISVLQCSSEELDGCMPQLFDLINHSYDSQDRSIYGVEDLFESQRLLSHEQLIQELGKHGLVAVAWNPRDHDFNDRPEESDNILAVACLKPWRGKTVDLWAQQSMSKDIQNVKEVTANDTEKVGQDWEVAICSSKNDPRYRKQGLITQCVAALIEHLHVSRRYGYGEDLREVSLWVTALEGVGNVEYWQRRGFHRQGGPDIAPAGLWGAGRSFSVGTLKKTVTFSD